MILLASVALAQGDASSVSSTLRPWKLAFERDGNIWVANGDGTEQKLLLKNAHSPAWSPDQKQLAFARNCNLWVTQADGSRQRSLTSQWKQRRPDMCEIAISWNPTQPSITFSHVELFSVKRAGGTGGISSKKRQRTGLISGSSIFDIDVRGKKGKKAAVRFDIFEDGTGFSFSGHSHPAWSRSGQRLASSRNGDIWVAEREEREDDEDTAPLGWNVTRMAAVASYDEPTMRASRENYGTLHISWSPDEKQIAYSIARLQGTGFAEIHVLDIGSREDRKLVSYGYGPVFSSDGKFIVYWTPLEEDCQGVKVPCICAVSLDGKTKRVLVENAGAPAW